MRFVGENLNLSAIVVSLPHERLEDSAKSVVMKKLPLTRTPIFLILVINLIFFSTLPTTFSHWHDKCAVTLEECHAIVVWMLEVDFDEVHPIMCNHMDPKFNWVGLYCTK